MLAMITYWVGMMPGQQATDTLMSPNGGLQLGCWAVDTASDKAKDVLSALRQAYADPLIAKEKRKEITAIESLKLDAIRQFRWVTDVLGRRDFPHGAAFQVMEPLESQLLTIVHNIRVEYVDH